MTGTQISSISNPANGLIVYCTSDNKIYIYVASPGVWKALNYGTAQILPAGACGNPITVNHQVSNLVAPVNKTVTYGTVDDIPGDTSKCWITSNLGSSHQATAVNDNTEESAGWYWQFNRKQGYKHTLFSITPAWTITDINESSDWTLTNDPCALELGTGWRIPTLTEWTNVSTAGNWDDWDDVWNSDLKLHAAGIIELGTGQLLNRGSYGYYWSSNQYATNKGSLLFFHSTDCILTNNFKAYGIPLRCLKD